MKAYKGFKEGLTCRGYQYKEGETYEEPVAKLCERGFHACEMPLDVLRYYAPAGSVYHEVELDGVSDERSSDDSKIVGTKIKIGTELGIAGLVRAQIEWVKEKIGFDKAIEKADASKEHHATGDQGAASATGYQGAASATGYQGAASATGDQGAASATGRECVALAMGHHGKAKGSLGNFIVLADWRLVDCEWHIVNVLAAKVDGTTIKADTWYTVQDGAIVEVEP